MQEIAVISDVHANMEALDAVLKEAGGLELYCLGDLVDYGAEPNEVISTVKARGAKCILGNHDAAALTGDVSLFSVKAAMSSKWTSRMLTVDSFDYLRRLPQEMRVMIGSKEVYFVHGTPDDRLWEYADPRTHSDLFGHYLGKLRVSMIGLGHTHIPYVWKGTEGVVFNPGSVGQPRDGDPRASFALLTVEGTDVRVEIRRASYDLEEAASKIREAGLPSQNSDRLFAGT